MKNTLVIISLLLLAQSISYGEPKSKHAVALKDAAQLASVVIEYIEYTNTIPSVDQGLSVLVSSPRVSPVPRRWKLMLDNIPKDPWGNEYTYIRDDIPDADDKVRLIILSYGPDGAIGGNDDIVVAWVEDARSNQ